MISMLCQKSNNGTITSTRNKNLFNLLILGEQAHKPIELIRKEPTLYDYQIDNSIIDLESINFESKLSETNDIKLNKNVDFNDSKTIHSNRNTVRLTMKTHKPDSITRSVKSSKNRSSLATPPIKVTFNEELGANSMLSMQKFNLENFHREQKKLNRKKLKHVKTLLDNQISKSVTHKEVYVNIKKLKKLVVLISLFTDILAI